MARVLLIGAGGVAGVAAVKLSQRPAFFEALTIASRTPGKCDAIADRIEGTLPVTTAALDADDPTAVADLIRRTESGIVLNAALPEQNIPVMEGCLAAGAHYIDTSAPEPVPGRYELFAYRWQLEFDERFRRAGLTALLSVGFDPGVLGAGYTGMVHIGCLVRGVHDGRPASLYLYSLCDHEEAFAETGGHAVSYTAGVPPVVAAELLLSPCTDWSRPGVWVPEDLPTAPFLTCLARRGLPWHRMRDLDLQIGNSA